MFLMLRLFTETIGEFLTDQLSELPEKPLVSYALPGSIAGRNALSIFLIGMTEDEELRSNEQQYLRVGAEWISQPPPIRLQCSYIVSAWPAAEDSAQAALIQLRLMCAAFRVFASIKTMPPGWLPAPMKIPGLPEPLIGLTKDELSGRPEFWAAAGCSFHAAFAFTATLALPAAETRYDHIVEKVLVDYMINK